MNDSFIGLQRALIETNFVDRDYKSVNSQTGIFEESFLKK